jgi:hypothetical protein
MSDPVWLPKPLVRILMIIATLVIAGFMKAIGLLATIVFGVGAVVYFIGKLAVGETKEPLLFSMAVMCTQSLWSMGVSYYVFHVTGFDLLAVSSAALSFIYLIGAIAFVYRPAAKSCIILFLYAALLFGIYVSLIDFDQLSEGQNKGVALSILCYVAALLSLPIGYLSIGRPQPS